MKIQQMVTSLCFGLLLAASAAATEPPKASLRSGVTATHLLELFSSEGCSSCPSADAWLASLRSRPGLWSAFIPLEFHVDYWNRLGWTDRFSKTAFTARQRRYAEEWGNGQVYTPGFVLDGREWRPAGLEGRFPEEPGPRVGVLEVRLDSQRQDLRRYAVRFSPEGQHASSRYEVHGALLGNGLESRVTSGENEGHTLRHEFVVLTEGAAPLESTATRVSELGATLELAEPRADQKEAAKDGLSLVVWVTDGVHQRPLQAVGGDLSKP